jgi:hypothetical protein
MYLKFSEKATNSLLQINLIDDGYEIVLELSLFAFNIKKEVCDVLKFFLSLKKMHNMFFYAKPYI